MSPDERIRDRVATEYEMKDPIDTCALLGLDDVPYTRCKFTWSNGSKFSKIDRTLVNEAWHNIRYLASTMFGPAGTHSDHSLAITTLYGDTISFLKPFKFFNFWANHAGYDPLLKEKWPINVNGTAQYVLAARGKAFKQQLREFNFKETSLISKRAKDATTELEKLQHEVDADTANIRLMEQIKTLRKEADTLCRWERQFFTQKAKLKHLLFSDRNTSFYHSLVNRNNSRNYISFLCSENGQVIKDQKEIIEKFVEYYSSLFGVRREAEPINVDILHNGYTLNMEESWDLIKIVTDEEIKEAVFSIGSDKAPGPDGYTSAFYKK